MTKSRPSPIALILAVGERVLDAVLAGEGLCPLCRANPGVHLSTCAVGLALLNPNIARRVRAAKEKARG